MSYYNAETGDLIHDLQPGDTVTVCSSRTPALRGRGATPGAASPICAPGFSVLMAPLALTSFNRAIKALGAARWKALHKSVYAIVLLGLLHFFWMRAAKNNFAEVAVYAAILGVLLGWRMVRHALAGAGGKAGAQRLTERT